jgi:hypothetical protein
VREHWVCRQSISTRCPLAIWSLVICGCAQCMCYSASVVTLGEGRCINVTDHTQCSHESDVFVGNFPFWHVHIKCGSINNARNVFKRMQYGYLEDHDSWTSEVWVWTQGIETISTDAISRGGVRTCCFCGCTDFLCRHCVNTWRGQACPWKNDWKWVWVLYACRL